MLGIIARRVGSGASKRTAKRQIRRLHTFSPQRPEVVFANNSGIFSTVASLKMHGIHEHPDLKVVVTPFWMDEIHQDYDDLDWGQTPHGLPWYARHEFVSLFPDHKQDQLIKWGQYRTLRASVIEQLSRIGVDVYHGNPHLHPTNNGLQLQVGDKQVHLESNTYFYNTFRYPIVEHGLDSNLPRLSHTELYKLPRSKVPKAIIVVGNGRSVIWLAQHFPTTVIICIGLSSSTFPLLTYENRPNNIILMSQEEITSGQVDLESINSHNNEARVMLTGHNDLGDEFVADMYCAIGLEPNTKLTDQVSQENVQLNLYDKPLTWIHRQEIPRGSLMESTLRWAAVTNNLSWAYETHSYHENYFIDLLTKKMANEGIMLPYTFFDELRETITNPPDTNQRSNLTDEETIEIYKRCYVAVHDQPIEKAVLQKIETVLNDCRNERYERYSNNNALNFRR